MISVVMTTYNGAPFIIKQLQSIHSQTCQPDEVLIFDDGSTDETVLLIAQYIKSENLGNKWKLVQNTTNKGWRQNFMDAFLRANHNLIFCADQDDIWMDQKIEKMASVMECNPQIEALACNLRPFYEKDAKNMITGKQIKEYGSGPLVKVRMDKDWLEPQRPGCCMCFRKELIETIEKLWFDDCAHDLIIWATTVARGTMYILNLPLIEYRRHGNNNSPSNAKTQRVRSNLMRIYKTISSSFLKYSAELSLPFNTQAFIRKMDAFFEYRYKAISQKDYVKLLCLLCELKLYPKASSWVADFIATCN